MSERSDGRAVRQHRLIAGGDPTPPARVRPHPHARPASGRLLLTIDRPFKGRRYERRTSGLMLSATGPEAGLRARWDRREQLINADRQP